MCEENCENCGSSRLKEFKYREGYGCWDCGYTSDDKDDKMACPECDSFVEDGSCLCGKTRIETSEKSLKVAARAKFFDHGPSDWVIEATNWGANYPGSRDNPAEYVRLRDVREAIECLKEKYSKQAEEANDRSRRLSLKEGVHALTFLEEEITQGESGE